jgi:hypothetical protein
MPYCKLCMLGLVAGSGLIGTTTVSTWTQPSMAGISGNIVCGTPQDHGTGYRIMAAVTVNIPTGIIFQIHPKIDFFSSKENNGLYKDQI